MSKGIIFMQPSYINFLRYYEKSITFGSYLMNRIQNTFQNVEVYYLYTSPNINLLRYYEKFFTFGRVMISKIQTTFQNVEGYYLYAAAIY